VCIAIPGRIIEIVDAERRLGRVDVAGSRRLVNLGLLGSASPGDWVLVQVGFAVEKIDESDARETLLLLDELGQAMAGDLAAAAREVPST
jgi:hydrogenase expression/formation protein HypC